MAHPDINLDDDQKRLESIQTQRRIESGQDAANAASAALLQSLNDYTGSLLEGSKAAQRLHDDSNDSNSRAGVLGGDEIDLYKNVGALGSNGEDLDTTAGVLQSSDDGKESDPDTVDPYSNQGLAKEIQDKLEQLAADLKAGKDITAELNAVFGQIETFGSNVLGQDAETQTALSGLTKVSSYVQNILNDKSDGQKDQYDVNPYTGQLETDKPKVSPEQALNDATAYLHDNAFSKYVLDPTTGKPKMIKDKDGNLVPERNKLYDFFSDPQNPQNHALMDSIKSNVESVTTALGAKDGSITVPDGAIYKMWKDDEGDYTKNPPVPSNPATLQAVQNGMGSLGQSLTSASSAEQALAKVHLQAQQSENATYNKGLQSEISINKAMVAGQKTSN